ncbi:hypothetical protein [Saccharothrix obliqua]|uniref:hypothetical protein n=1 Tax=Saccharothrix obliqua TaxID=2861747 RepID=UPI001C5EC877|nr:hypothetical protein [Saccharothrix obliqua]MBW4717178.1 hypothetical protein [Saccharothrix obliqua]
MVTSSLGSSAAQRTGPVGWVLRAVVSAHAVAIVGQPVFAGVYLTGDFDGLSRHAVGADVVTSIGYLQLIAAVAVWVRLRRVGPFLSTAAVVVAETVQYFAGLAGALWLHVPLGVMTVAALVVQFIAVWRQPLRRVREEARDAR